MSGLILARLLMPPDIAPQPAAARRTLRPDR
jgi:hypothetical protein